MIPKHEIDEAAVVLIAQYGTSVPMVEISDEALALLYRFEPASADDDARREQVEQALLSRCE